MVSTAEAAGGLGLADTNDIDGYVAVSDVKGLVSRQGLIRDEDGRVTLRATSMDPDVVRNLSKRTIVLAALDLAESLDVRERRAGLDVLDGVLRGTFR